jgi:CDP-6-deoxy-D-xylo-4-hexulose-3-dehydrase
MENIQSQIDNLVEKYYDALSKKRTEEIERISLSAPSYDSREAVSAIRTILSGWISQGPNVRQFETAFSQYIGRTKGIAVNSGSSANLLAILALKDVYGLRDGDEVILPAATFSTVAMPIIQAGLMPVYVDVKRDTLNIDPEQIDSAVSDKSRILMPVHTLGYPAEMNRLVEVSNHYQLTIFEDCCEAHGSSIDGKKAGSFGELSTFSFFVAHNMTTGEGGMIVTNNERLEDICRSLREFGRCNQKNVSNDRYFSDEVLNDYDRRYVFDRLGYNLRMTDITAAFGIVQLAKLEDMNNKRRNNAAFLTKILSEEVEEFIELPPEQPGYLHTYYTYSIVLKENVSFTRRQFAEHLEKCKIETRPLFAGCLPDQPVFRGAPGRIVGDLSNSRYLRDNLVFIGIHPALNKQHIEYIADVIVTFIKDKAKK